MDSTPPFDTSGTLRRRQLIKRVSAAAALTGLSMGAGRGFASDVDASQEVLDVAIIGAGLAGLTAARDLRRAGCESFLVLEARDRVGGRTLNHDLGNGYISEAGGQWIGPGQTSVADLARELNVDTFPQYYEGKTVMLGGDGRIEIDLKGTFGTDEKIAAKLSELSHDVPSGAPWKSRRIDEFDIPIGDWLAQQDIKPEERPGWDSTFTLTTGAMPAKMGMLHFLSMINSANSRYSELEDIKDSAQGTRFVGGSQILSTRLAQQLDDKVRLSCPVRRISDWDQDVVTLHTDQGEVRARQVVMALSPPLCQQIQFEPALPAARANLQRAWPAHSPGRKTAMVYKRPFWRDEGLNGHIFQVGGPLLWAYDNSPPGGEIGVINAFHVNAALPSEPDAAQAMLTEIYAQALGSQALAPVSFHDHDWAFSDPWTITCVSAIPAGFWPAHGEALRPPCGKLIWSGTETADIWAGYMDGAVRSGHQAALQALNALRPVDGRS